MIDVFTRIYAPGVNYCEFESWVTGAEVVEDIMVVLTERAIYESVLGDDGALLGFWRTFWGLGAFYGMACVRNGMVLFIGVGGIYAYVPHGKVFIFDEGSIFPFLRFNQVKEGER